MELTLKQICGNDSNESQDFEQGTNGRVFILSLQLRSRKCQLKQTKKGNLEQEVTRLISDKDC